MSFKMSYSLSLSKSSSNLSSVPSLCTKLPGRAVEDVRKPAAQLSRRSVGPHLQGPRSLLSVSTPRSAAKDGIASSKTASYKKKDILQTPTYCKIFLSRKYCSAVSWNNKNRFTHIWNSFFFLPTNQIKNLIQIYKEVPERGPVPIPPSPRFSKRQQKEKLLQEHKTLGRQGRKTRGRGIKEKESPKRRAWVRIVRKREDGWNKKRKELKTRPRQSVA